MNDRWNEFIKKALVRTQRQDREEFIRWLQSVGQPEPDTRAAWSRLRNLYDFFKWVRDREAVIADSSPSKIVAADGPEVRRWEPNDGLTIQDWPYLKLCCGPEGEDFTETCRNEIVEAILTNRLQRIGYSYGVASSAVGKFGHLRDEVASGWSLWEVMENIPFDEIADGLSEMAETIAAELRDYERIQAAAHSPRVDGPEYKKLGIFRWRGTPYHLGPHEFDLVSALWDASDRSLQVWEVLKRVWDIRPAAHTELNKQKHKHMLSQSMLRANNALTGTHIKIRMKKNTMGEERVWLILP